MRYATGIGRIRWAVGKLILPLILALAGQTFVPAYGQEEVDLELVLLADATGSIDDAEIRFQREGYATAIVHEEVLAAISKGFTQRIALTYVEWGDETSQEIVVPWTIIDGLGSARVFAGMLLKQPRMASGYNAIGAALAKAHDLIRTNEISGLRRVIDFSADSANNWSGVPIEVARAAALSDGLIINGLAILCRDDDCGGRPVAYDLETAFAKSIIGGPGSFVVTVDGRNSFAEAVRRKLVLEIADGSTRSGRFKKARLLPAVPVARPVPAATGFFHTSREVR